ncbi:conserved hypothetical protein [Histoplasma capsulatum H143]|uniref:Aminoglycoside phosphotransferase domain-containing protein n=1 Tax=Ajellomyces capsulatus (strain H143) TaxID=544712 RepID=C6H8B6_AJECH|nr:conserved hypothetical protein [Histoplasma capsulatum H143]
MLNGRETSSARNAQQLPFNLYIKRTWFSRLQYEARARELVAKHTTLNAPRVLDLIELSGQKGSTLTTRIKGDIAGKHLPSMNTNELEQFIIDFRKLCGKKIRSIPNPYPHLISNPLGGACQDCRVDNEKDSTGPYDKTSDLNSHLVKICSPIPDAADRAKIADTSIPANVLTHNDKLSGFVDWEFAG